ncbi:response regulator [Virgibacillus ainsalahensis]
MEKLTIAIIDDQPLMVDGLRTILDLQEGFQVIGTANNGREALTLAKKQPHIMLMDVHMPIMNGIETTKQIKQEYPDIMILMTSSHTSGEDVIRAIANGANGYLLKDWETEQIIQAIWDVTQNKIPMPTFAGESIAKLFNSSQESGYTMDYKWDSQNFPLSKREKELAFFIMNRLTNEEIATELYLSIGTVKNYITSLYKKLGVRTRREAIKLLEENVSE